MHRKAGALSRILWFLYVRLIIVHSIVILVGLNKKDEWIKIAKKKSISASSIKVIFEQSLFLCFESPLWSIKIFSQSPNNFIIFIFAAYNSFKLMKTNIWILLFT